jgi:orotate phosphoribosyltransferase-like protein
MPRAGEGRKRGFADEITLSKSSCSNLVFKTGKAPAEKETDVTRHDINVNWTSLKARERAVREQHPTAL